MENSPPPVENSRYAIIVHMNHHFLQSEIWEKYEKTERHTVFRLTNSNYNCLVVKTHTQLGDYFYLPYGPDLKIGSKAPNFSKTGQTTIQPTSTAQKSLEKALTALRTHAKDAHAYFIRIEPTVAFTPAQMAQIAQKTHFKLKKSKEINPAHTWIVDLSLSEAEILSNIEKPKVRRWRNHVKKGLSIRTTKDPEEIKTLTHFLQQVGEKNNFIPQSKQHLKNQLKSGFATLYIADYQNPAEPKSTPKPIAAALVYDWQGVRYSVHAASDPAPEFKNLAAPSILIVQIILDAKKLGAHTYDLWGITTSQNPNHPWYGFTQYKKTFGGRQIDYTGTYDFVLRPVKYRLYQILRRINRALRKK